jgi:hypothetical protein
LPTAFHSGCHNASSSCDSRIQVSCCCCFGWLGF